MDHGIDALGAPAPLPTPRGPASEELFARLRGPLRRMGEGPSPCDDPVAGEDAALTLFALYELHYRGFEGVDEDWEWEPGLLAWRAALERHFEEAVRDGAPPPAVAPGEAVDALIEMVRADDGPSLSRHLARTGTLEQFQEFVIHRSAYQLKEADPHSWAIPRLAGRAKAALVEIQCDEYGGGRAEWIHAELFRRTMLGLGLDGAYGAYLDRIPGLTLSTVNLMSFFGLHRRLRGALAGHLAVLESTSSIPMRRYGDGLRRLGFGPQTTRFFDEHVEADAMHEQVAVHDLCGGLCAQDPMLAPDVLLGAAAVLWIERRFAGHMLESWAEGSSSLLTSQPSAAPV
jgi:hypothetical protein